MNHKRKIAALVLSAFILVFTAGCIKLDMNLKVSNQDTVSGEITLALSKALTDYASQSGGNSSGLPQTNDLLAPGTKAEMKKYDDGKFVGSTYVLKDVPIAKFATSDPKALSITRSGDYLIVSGTIDGSGGDAGSANDAMNNPLTAGMFAGSEIKVAITLPGTIQSTTGVQSGNTITWSGKFGDTLDIQAKTLSPKGAVDFTPIIIGVVVVALIAGAVVFIRRNRAKAAQAVEAPEAAETD